jgi:hypothetical protein
MNTLPPATAASRIEIPQSVQNIGNSISESMNNLSQKFSSSISEFSQQTQTGAEASSGFLSSNTIIAKFAFLILVIIIFLFLLNLGVLIIQYFMNPSSSPYLVNGMIDGTSGAVVSQDPKQSGSVLIRRSNNESSGIEFTWSTWIRIDELPGSGLDNKYRHVFHKGTNEFNEVTGIAKINNGPGLYIAQITPTGNASASYASLRVVMSTTTSGSTEFIDVDDIPLKQWVNVIIRLQNTTMDVYINGTVAGRLNLSKVPLQNYYDVNICKNGGFLGKLSNLRYYDHALNIFQISKIVAAGPNTSTATTKKEMTNYNYLSMSWYTAKL